VNSSVYANSGILLVDKPQDWTSHDVVNCVRSRFKVKKVGHCGTLDPMATGLLVIVLGKATKIAAKFSGQDKVYVGTMMLGTETDSQDSTGVVTASADYENITEEQIRDSVERFTGDIMQIPPMVSAVKKNGTALYKLARKGIVVEREPRPATIHRFELNRIAIPEVDFLVECSKGTYIRTLCHDIGRDLGICAHMSALRRTKSGMFLVDDAVSIEQIKSWEREDLFANFIPLAQVAEMVLRVEGKV